MPKNKRHPTRYPGVYFIEAHRPGQKSKTERIYYIVYRKDGKRIEEKAGRHFRNNMTPWKASSLRGEKIEGVKPSNKANREKERKEIANNWTFNALWAEYTKVKSTKSIVADSKRYARHIEGPLGNRQPKDLILLDIDRIRINLSKTLEPGTVRNILEQIRRISNFGANRGLCKGMKFRIKMPTLNNSKTEDLTKNEMSRLLAAIDKDILKNQWPHGGKIMKLILLTGLRRNEVFKLQWPDVKFERDEILIRNPKSGIDKIIPLNAEAKALLKSHPKTENSPFVFPNKKGGQMLFVGYYLKGIIEKARLPEGFRALHGLRHVYASMLVSSGQVDLYQLKELLTHANVKTTERYSHLRNRALRKAAEVATMENYLK